MVVLLNYRVRVHGGLSKVFVLESGLQEVCPSSPVSFPPCSCRARRKEVVRTGQIDEGIDWVVQVDGGLYRPRSAG